MNEFQGGEVKLSKLKNPNGNRVYVGGSRAVSPKSLQIVNSKQEKDVRVALLGASGYTGAEVSKFDVICVWELHFWNFCFKTNDSVEKIFSFSLGGRLLGFSRTIHSFALLWWLQIEMLANQLSQYFLILFLKRYASSYTPHMLSITLVKDISVNFEMIPFWLKYAKGVTK